MWVCSAVRFGGAGLPATRYYTGRTLVVEDVIDLSRMLGIGLAESCDDWKTARAMPHLLCDSIPHGRWTCNQNSLHEKYFP
eukprot:3400371-Amphidinium_carterae.1